MLSVNFRPVAFVSVSGKLCNIHILWSVPWKTRMFGVEFHHFSLIFPHKHSVVDSIPVPKARYLVQCTKLLQFSAISDGSRVSLSVSSVYHACLFKFVIWHNLAQRKPSVLFFLSIFSPYLILLLSTYYPGPFKKDFCLLFRGLSVISRLCFIPTDPPIDKICDLHIMIWETLSMKIVADPTYPLCNNDWSSCCRNAFTCPKNGLISSWTNIYHDSTFSCLARILVKTEEIIRE